MSLYSTAQHYRHFCYGCRIYYLGSCCPDCSAQPLNKSNKTVVIPREGESSFQAWKEYNPESDWTEEQWLEEYVKGKKGEDGEKGDTYIPIFDDNISDI